MTRLKRLAWITSAVLFSLLLSLVLLLAYLGATQDGTRRLFGWAQAWLPGELTLNTLEGSLLGPLRIQGLSYRQTDGLQIENALFQFDWLPGELWSGELKILELSLQDTALTLPESAPSEADSTPFQGVSLPLAIELVKLDIGNLRILSGAQADPVVIERLSLSAATQSQQLSVSTLHLAAFSAQVDVDGTLDLSESLPADLNLAWRYRVPDGPELSGRGRLQGDLQRYQLTQQTDRPIAGKLDAELRELLVKPAWQARLDWTSLELEAFASGFPAVVQGRMDAQGDFEGFQLDTTLDLDEPTLGRLHSVMTARLDPKAVSVESLKLTNAESLEVAAKGDYQISEGAFKATLDWRNLGWPLEGAQDIISPQGSLSLNGTPDAYAYEIDLGLSREEISGMALSANGQGSLEGLSLERLNLQQGENALRGEGRVDWSPELAWTLSLEGEGLDPILLSPDFPGSIDLKMKTQGQLAGEKPQGELGLEFLRGTLRGYPVSAQGRLSFAGSEIELPRLALNSGANQIEAKGRLGEQLDLNWKVNGPELEALWPGLSGRLEGTGALKGTPDAPVVSASLNARTLGYAGVELAQLEAILDLDMSEAQKIDARVSGQGLDIDGREWQSIQLTTQGSLPRHQLKLSLQGETVPQLNLEADAGLDEANRWQGVLQTLALELPQHGVWSLHKAVDFSLAAEAQRLQDLCLVQEQSRVCADFNASGEGGWQSDVLANDFDLGMLQPLLTRVTRLSGRMQMAARIEGEDSGRIAADIKASLPEGSLSFDTQNGEQQIDFSRTEVTARLDDQGAQARATLPLKDLGGFETDLSLPGFHLPDTPWESQALQGKIKGRIDNLSLLSLLMPKLQNSHGVLQADFALAGTLGSPRFQGGARLEDGSIDIPELGVGLRDIVLKIQAPELDRVQVTGQLRSGKGQLNLKGFTRLDASQGFPSEYQIEGEDFQVVDTPEAEVQVSPKLTFKQTAAGSQLEGNLHVPYARLRPRSLPKSAVSNSSDMVITGDDQAEASSQDTPLHARVRLSLGKRVSFDGFGLRGNFTGSLLLIDEPGRPVIGRGRLGIENGVYQAYGQDLTIERGFALFADNPVDNPGLDVRAVREVNDVTAGMRVTGTLKNPKLKLFSTPPMIESEILTYIITGRPPGESGQSVGVAAALKASGAGSLAEELGRQFGLEELRVDTGSSLDEAALVAGTYLSPKLYVQYINELSTGESKLRMRYDLTDRWQVEAESGNTQAGDFFYTFER
ncbi:MAG: translocation/assembly module TamB domain-containing protein [Candidatus Thiodiazotropha sp.]